MAAKGTIRNIEGKRSLRYVFNWLLLQGMCFKSRTPQRYMKKTRYCCRLDRLDEMKATHTVPHDPVDFENPPAEKFAIRDQAACIETEQFT